MALIVKNNSTEQVGISSIPYLLFLDTGSSKFNHFILGHYFSQAHKTENKVASGRHGESNLDAVHANIHLKNLCWKEKRISDERV